MTAFTGKHFYDGSRDLPSLRVGDKPLPKVTPGPPPVRLHARVPSDECGCPEELWTVDGLQLLFHFEDDGPCDAFIFAGDWEMETTIEAETLDELRALSFLWLAQILKPSELQE